MPTVYIHIGYPKCFSTTLQRSYFEKHPAIHYGGVGVENNISYSNSHLELAFESLLKYANEPYWIKTNENVKDFIEEFVAKCENKKIVFSSEHLSMNFTFQGINNEIKYERLQKLFGAFNIKILAIRRDPINLLKSLYSEFVKMGHNKTYINFLKWIITFQDRNFLPDLNYDLKNEQISKIFGKENITWLSFEEIKKEGVEKSLNNKLSKWLQLKPYHIPIKNDNPSLSENQVMSLLDWNIQNPRGLSKGQTEPFEKHRSRLLYQQSGLDYSEEEVFSEVLAKRKALTSINSIKNDNTIGFENAAAFEKKVIDAIGRFTP